MKTTRYRTYITVNSDKNRAYRRKRTQKSYIVLTDEVLQLYRDRKIFAIDVKIFVYLCNLRRKHNGVCATQSRIAFVCGITEKTVAKSTERLYKCGLITGASELVDKSKPKYIKPAYIYFLKPLPVSGFFFCPRSVFKGKMPHKSFAILMFMCNAHSFEYGISWNSYNDICEQLGFSVKSQRSEIISLIGGMEEHGILQKTVRKIRGGFADNIYCVTGFETAIVSKSRKSPKREKRSDGSGTQFKNQCEKTFFTVTIVPQGQLFVKPQFVQCRLNF
jgi:hypothetical protein